MLIHQPNITGSLLVNGEESAGTGFPFSGSASITGSLEVSGSTISGSFVGDGSGIQNVDYNNLTNIPTDFSGSFTGSIQADSLILPKGTTAEREPNPEIGEIRYNTDDGIGIEVYNGNRWYPLGTGFVQLPLGVSELSVTANDAVFLPPLEVEYLVIAGGGSGGYGDVSGGGGAGGYRSSVSGESSGGGASAESSLELDLSTNYTVTVGAGGAAPVSLDQRNNGSNSVFSTITSTGGGGGGGNNGQPNESGASGGSGGGGAWQNGTGGAGTANQGYAGGDSTSSGFVYGAGGGGGAGEVGQDGNNTKAGNGGDGVSSSITGSAVTRAGGGGGAEEVSRTPQGLGGAGGGGNGGSLSVAPQNGTANTGGGGGGTENAEGTGASGGSGIVILRYPSSFSITVGAGLTSSTSTVGANKVTTFTAGTDTISFS